MPEYQVRLRAGGTLTLPQELQEQYHLDDGETFNLVDLDGVFVLSPKTAIVPKLASEIERLRIEAGIDLADLIDAARRDRDGSSAAG